jgi:osmotically-inducible protein OsmY
MRIARTLIFIASFFGFLGTAAPAGAQQKTPPQKGTQNYEDWLKREVRHELVLLPWLSVFDNLEYTVNGYQVILKGQVVRPSTKSDAEAAVKKIEGVESVDNEIEVLPVSTMDDQTRMAEYHAIYSQPMLERYSQGNIQSIHIVVKNGHVTLEGTVANDSDKNVAGIQANSVPNVFSVTNNLRVEGSAK